MRRWEPFPEEKGRCVKGGVVGPSGVSAAPERAGCGRSPPGSSLPPPVSESFCPLWALLLPPAGPRSPRKDKVQLLSVSQGPDWPRGGVCVELNSGAAKRPWSKWAGVPALPPRCVLSSRKSQNQSGHPRPLLAWPPSEGCRRGRPSGCLRPDMPRGCWVPRAWHLGGSPKPDRGPGGEASG